MLDLWSRICGFPVAPPSYKAQSFWSFYKQITHSPPRNSAISKEKAAKSTGVCSKVHANDHIDQSCTACSVSPHLVIQTRLYLYLDRSVHQSVQYKTGVCSKVHTNDHIDPSCIACSISPHLVIQTRLYLHLDCSVHQSVQYKIGRLASRVQVVVIKKRRMCFECKEKKKGVFLAAAWNLYIVNHISSLAIRRIILIFCMPMNWRRHS